MSKQDFLDENDQRKQYFLLPFHKTYRTPVSEKNSSSVCCIFLVTMLEAAKTTGVEQDKNDHNLYTLI